MTQVLCHKPSAGPRLGHAANVEGKPVGAQERQRRFGFAEGEEGAGFGMSHGGCQPLWGEGSVGGGTVALWVREGPWGTHAGEEPSRSEGTCAVPDVVLVC